MVTQTQPSSSSNMEISVSSMSGRNAAFQHQCSIIPGQQATTKECGTQTHNHPTNDSDLNQRTDALKDFMIKSQQNCRLSTQSDSDVNDKRTELQQNCRASSLRDPDLTQRSETEHNRCASTESDSELIQRPETQDNCCASTKSDSKVTQRTEPQQHRRTSSLGDLDLTQRTQTRQKSQRVATLRESDLTQRTNAQQNRRASSLSDSYLTQVTETQQNRRVSIRSDSDLTQVTKTQQNRRASKISDSNSPQRTHSLLTRQSSPGLNTRWSYVVILCSFLVTVLTLGFKTSLGVFYTEWEYYFDVSKTEVSWVTSLSPMVIGITSLFATGTAHVFGTRLPVVFGGIVTSSAILASCFADTIVHLTISLGIISAIGMGFAFAPSIAILHHYFEKRFHIAIGIAIAGYSFGDLIFPLILQPMIEKYGWKGALFVMSAVELNLVACGCVMKLPGKMNEEESSRDKKEPDTFAINNAESAIVELDFNDENNIEKSHVAPKRADIVQFLQVSESSNFHDIVNEGFVDDEFVTAVDTSTENSKVAKLTNTPKHKTDVLLNLSSEIIFKRQPSKLMKRQASKLMHDFRKEGYNLLRPLRSPIFLLMLLVMLLHGIGWYAVIANLVPFAIAHKIPDIQAAELLTFIGVGSLVGCLSQGWIIDKTIVTSTCAKTSSLVALTIITLWYPFTYNCYPSMVTLSVFYGLAAGVSLSLFFALVGHLLPPVDAGAGVSLIIVAEMLGDTIGGVLAGVLNDAFENFTASFYFAGLAIALATILQLFVSIFKRQRRHIDHRSSKDICTDSDEIEKCEHSVTSGKGDPTVFVIETHEIKS